MTMPRARTRWFALAVLVTVLSVGLQVPAEADHRRGYSPQRIALPDGFRPEGIAIGTRPIAYLGSLADGDIYAADLRTGRGRVVVEGPGTPSVGLKVSRDGRTLYVAGGPTGEARVIDLRSGTTRTYSLSTLPSFINDVVLTKRAAWFTNSSQPELYRLSRRTGVVTTVPLTGEWVQAPGFNANGIARTPDGKALLVVNSTAGALFRVDPDSGQATRVDLDGFPLVNGDGLLVRGRTLYVVQNRLNQVAVFTLNRPGTAGTPLTVLTNPHFDVPTTIAAHRGSLYLPNARFTTPPTPDTDYWITRIREPRA